MIVIYWQVKHEMATTTAAPCVKLVYSDNSKETLLTGDANVSTIMTTITARGTKFTE